MILLVLAGDADWVEVHIAATHMALTQVYVPKSYVTAFLLPALKTGYILVPTHRYYVFHGLGLGHILERRYRRWRV